MPATPTTAETIFTDPQLARLSCALLVLTAGASIAVNAVRAIRYASIARHV